MTGMIDTLIRAAAFIAMIALGYFLKKKGIFRTSDFYVLSNIIVRVTLPCAIIVSFSENGMDVSMLLLCVLGIICNLIMMGVGFAANLKRSGDEKAFDMLNLAGFNLGNFTLPFVQSSLGPAGVAATGLFDMGNALMNTGGNYSVVSVVRGSGEAMGKTIVKSLSSSPPFLCYLIMITVSLCEIPIPKLIMEFAKTAGSCNTFLSFFMIGIGLEIHINRRKMAQIARLLILRFGACIILSAGFYCFFPMSLEIRQTLALLMLAPVSTLGAVYTGKIGGDVELATALSSVEILVSIGLTICALLLIM